MSKTARLIQVIIQQRKLLLEIENFLARYPDLLFDLTVEDKLVHRLELTFTNLTLHPTASPYQLKQVIEKELSCTFTRVYEAGFYQWDTVPPGCNFVLRIQANEHVDLTGTVPQ